MKINPFKMYSHSPNSVTLGGKKNSDINNVFVGQEKQIPNLLLLSSTYILTQMISVSKIS